MDNSLLRINRYLFFILLFFGLLYLGRPFLIPVAIGALLAMLLLPLCRQFERWRLSRALSSFISVLLLVIILSALFYFITRQITSLLGDLPAIKERLQTKLDFANEFLDEKLDVKGSSRNPMLHEQVNDFFTNVGNTLTRLLYSTGFFIMNFFVVIVYTFFFLTYRTRIKNFILSFLNRRMEAKATDIFRKISLVANSYITGVFLVVLILSVINTLGLMVIGVEHALFFGVLAGILNIIPYLGSIAGSLIPVFFVFVTRESYSYVLIVALFFIVVQLVESYVFTPNITGNKVRLNPLATVMALLLGALVWGIAGMILFIPYLGIGKVVLDNIEKLQRLGYLIGTEKENSL